MLRPYIGITGITDEREQDALLAHMEQTGLAWPKNGEHIGMAGYAVDWDAITSGRPRGPRYVASIRTLGELIGQARRKALTMVHFTPSDSERFAEDALDFLDQCPLPPYALQLNNIQPNRRDLRRIVRGHPHTRLIFQLGSDMLAREMESVWRMLWDIHRNVRGVLLDPSLGTGTSDDADRSIAIAQYMRDQHPNITVGFAGGFTADNVSARIRTIRAAFGDRFSIDCESDLRDDADTLDLDRARAYLTNAAEAMRS